MNDKRIIKFRGKVLDEPNEWVYGYLNSKDTIYQDEETENTKCCGIGIFKVDENTIGQFTGLYDKNGKEIYEGDIVKFKMYYGNYENYYIVFRNLEFEAINKNDSNFIGFEIWETEGEVIGNIYDNLELLEVD